MVKNPFEYAQGRRLEITRKQQREIKEIYRDALRDIKYKYGRLENKTSRYAENKKLYLDSLKREYEQQIKDIGKKTESTIMTNSTEMVNAVLQNNEMYLNGLGYNSYINNYAIRTDVINRLATGQVYGGSWNLSSAIWGDDAAKIKEINTIIARGVAEGKSLFNISKQLEKYVNPDKLNLTNIPGIRTKVDYNAQRLARTMIQHAYQEAFVAATIHNPFIEAYQWITSGSDRVCELCMERESEDHYGLGPGVFPKDSLPLDHPNGQCTFDIVVTMSDDEMADAIADWYLGVGDEEMNKELTEFAEYLANY